MANNLEHYKDALTKELKNLDGELRTVGRVNPDNPKDWEPTPAAMNVERADSSEVAENISEYEEHTAVLKQLEIRYNEVKDALKRIEGGAFGLCSVCRKEIETGRLEANPAATTCTAHMK